MRLFQKLYGGLQCFFMLSTRYAVLFRALNPLLLKLSSADCSQIWAKNASRPRTAGVCRSRPGSKPFPGGGRILFHARYKKLPAICPAAIGCLPPSAPLPGQNDCRDSAETRCRCRGPGKRPGSPRYSPGLVSEPGCGSWPPCPPGRSRCSPAGASACGKRRIP